MVSMVSVTIQHITCALSNLYLVPSMRIAYVELRIYVISKSVIFRRGTHTKIKPPELAGGILRTLREILLHLVVGLR